MKTLLFWSTFSGLLLFSCSSNPTDSQNSGVRGRFLDESGSPASGAFVYTYPVDYIPSFSEVIVPADTTGGNGYYEIAEIDPGIYNIEGQYLSSGVFIDSVEVDNDTRIAEHILISHGTITGLSYMPGQNDTNQVRVTIYMPGTQQITKPVIGGKFVFGSVPEGTYQMIIDPTLDDYRALA